MSLISEALKEAQRSHSQHQDLKGPVALGDTFFPYPEGHKSARSSNVALLVSGLAVIVLVIGGAVVARVRRHPSAGIPALIGHVPLRVVPPPIIPDTAVPADTIHVASAPSMPAASPADNSNVQRPPAAPRVIAQSVSSAAKPKAAPAQPTAAPAADTVLARSDATHTPPALPAPQHVAASPGVHVVLDAGSARPTDSLFKQAFAEQTRGNFERSRELYERVIAVPQAPAEAFNDYGVLLLQNGNLLGASEMFKQALKRDDKNVDAWVNLGDSYNAIGHHAEAMGAFGRAGQLDASSIAVKVRLAAEYQAIGDTAVAHRMYDEAAKLSPRDPSVHYNYGKFFQAQRDFRSAIREYQLFVDLAPGKFSAENIAMIRKYIVMLGQYVR